MSSRFALAVWAITHREMLHFWRERSRVAGFLGSPLIFWAIIGSGFGDFNKFFSGSLLLSVMFTAVFSNMSVIDDRRAGFLQSALSAPVPRCAIVIGKVLGGSIMSLIQGLVFCLFLPFAGSSHTAATFAYTTFSLLLTGFAFTSIGFWLAWRSRTSQGFHAIMNILLMPLWMVSGALFDQNTAVGWMKAVMRFNPMTYFNAVLRRALLPDLTWPGPSFSTGVLVTAICGLAFLTAAIYAVERKPQGSFAE
jgi:ABC-2 type transport system permease protein